MMFECLRWGAILPAAIGAFWGIELIFILGGTLGAEMEGRAPMPNWVFQLFNSIISPIAFVWAGAKVAPKYRSIVAICLTVLISAFIASVTSIAILKGVRSYPLWWVIVTSVVSIISATVYCVFFLSRQTQ